MDLNNLILFLVLIGFGLFFYKYFTLILNKHYPKMLIDNQLGKPQAYHMLPTSTTGGLLVFLSFLIVFFYFLVFKNIIFLEYLTFCTLIFFIGFADDLTINIKPRTRLFLMIIFLVFLVKYNNFYIESTGIEFLNSWLENSGIFSLIFVCLCFLFIINGANLIDGYNGLLGIHSLIILINLFLINLFSENNDLANFLLFSILILMIFLKLNFPKAKIFLGDGGSYFLGTFIAISVILTSIANPSISPFYFCILLFYLFFEVFFSFFRKIFVVRQSPLFPDSKHLHMLLYKFFLKQNKKVSNLHYKVSLYINSIYLFLLIPGIIFSGNGLFCRYYFFFLLILYIYFYRMLNEKVK